MKRLIAFVIVVFAFLSALKSQNDFSGITCEVLSKKDGLSSNYISGNILQDEKGYLWISTIDGLNRYDGIHFKIYKPIPDDSSSLQENIIRGIFLDRLGHLWIRGENINQFDSWKERFIAYPTPTVKNRNEAHYKTLFDDSKGNIWSQFNNDLDGILRLDPKTGIYSNLNIIAGRFIHPEVPVTSYRLVLIDDNDNLWISVQESNGELSLLKINIYGQGIFQKWYRNLARYNMTYSDYDNLTPLSTHDKKIRFAALTTILKYDPQKDIVIQDSLGNRLAAHLKGKKIEYTLMDQDEHLWMWATLKKCYYDNGLKFLDISQLVNEKNYVSSVFQDHSGIMWVGTSNGLFKLNIHPKKFHALLSYKNVRNSLLDNYIHCLYVDHKNHLWVSTGAGLSKIDFKTGSYDHFIYNKERENIMSYHFYNSITEFKNGALLCGASGLNIILPAEKIFQYALPDLSNPSSLNDWVVWKIHKGNVSGRYWIATHNGCCELLSSNELVPGKYASMDARVDRFYYFPYNKDSEESLCFEIYEDHKGIVWIGSKNGLTRYDPATRKQKTFSMQRHNPDALNATTVTCIYEDKKERLWVGTEGGGLNLFNRQTNTFTHYTMAEGLANNMVWGILEDVHGNLWISTTNGLSKFNPAASTFSNFDVMDGLPDMEFQRGAFCKGRNGMMYFGTSNGVLYFDPDSIFPNSSYPKIVIEKLFLFNKEVGINQVINGDTILKKSLSNLKEVVLSNKNNVISFSFLALHYTAPLKNKYAYKLEGFDTCWNSTSNHFAYYMNLNPGKYTFRVRAANCDGIWNPDDVKLSLVILPSVGETWWFRLLLVVSGILIFLFLFNYFLSNYKRIQLQRAIAIKTSELNAQKAELIRLNETKNKFFYIIGHDLKNPFQAINGMSELLNKAFEFTPDEQKREMIKVIEKASKSATELLENLLLWARSQTGMLNYQPEKFDLFEIVISTCEMMRVHAESKDINIINNVEKEEFVYADRNMIQTVIRNIISNAIKFTRHGGTIQIYLEKGKFIEFFVKDSGIGMDEETRNNLFQVGAQFNTKGTAGESGTGLGLILCKEFIEMHDGELRYATEPEKGTIFSFTLPR